ncbi:transmembrane protein 238-like isoform X2 [Lampris incognitus]|uniref:transmembrane protein 238-like isoform X2 n=1 Tax=Lampris incognitus TaxID=2546036 RepID=UPI0024B4EAC6|nr:transmembrane protein 238-like isoform X2 [Lampris incognitus]
MRAGRVGRCVSAFLAAVVLDVLGLVVLFVGIFADLRVDGEFYGDFLVYSGSLGIFSSLAFWVVWYIGNIQGSDDAVDSGHLKKTGSLVQLARKLSERLNGTRRGEAPRARSVEEADSGRVDVSLRKASKVTWGKSTAYVNGGYDGDGLDSFAPYDETKKRPAIPQRDSMSPPTTDRS